MKVLLALAMAVAVLAGVLVILIGVAAVTTPSGPHSPDRAYAVCRQFVEKRLRAPRTAEFPSFYERDAVSVTSYEGGEYRVQAYVDAQNGFGAMIRTHFTCEVKHVRDNTYELQALDMK